MPVSLPSCMTMILSHMPSSSGISLEIKMMLTPRAVSLRISV